MRVQRDNSELAGLHGQAILTVRRNADEGDAVLFVKVLSSELRDLPATGSGISANPRHPTASKLVQPGFLSGHCGGGKGSRQDLVGFHNGETWRTLTARLGDFDAHSRNGASLDLELGHPDAKDGSKSGMVLTSDRFGGQPFFMPQVFGPARYILRRYAACVVVPDELDEILNLVLVVAGSSGRFAVRQVVALPQFEQITDADLRRLLCRGRQGREAVCVGVRAVVAFGALQLLFCSLAVSPVGLLD